MWESIVRHLTSNLRGEPNCTLLECMHGDVLSAGTACLLCVFVLSAYWVIAWRWSHLADGSETHGQVDSLRTLRWIFIWCGVCGYGFVPMKMFFPAWKLWMPAMVMLGVISWRFALVGYRDLFAYYEHKRMARRVRSVVDDMPPGTLRDMLTEITSVSQRHIDLQTQRRKDGDK